MIEEVKSLKDRTDLFNFESVTLLDEELADGILKPNKLNLATVIIFICLELILFAANYFIGYTPVQLAFFSVFGLFLARQIALDFAYHIFLDIYTLPMGIAAFLAPSMLLGYSSELRSFGFGVAFFIAIDIYNRVCSWIVKRPAGFGGGDVKFVFIIGAFLASGFSIWINMFLFSIMSLVITMFYENKEEVPMGPGLLLSFWICLLFNSELLNIFLRVLN